MYMLTAVSEDKENVEFKRIMSCGDNGVKVSWL